MASTVRSHRGEAGLWKMLAIGVLALLAFIWWDTYTAAGPGRSRTTAQYRNDFGKSDVL